MLYFDRVPNEDPCANRGKKQRIIPVVNPKYVNPEQHHLSLFHLAIIGNPYYLKSFSNKCYLRSELSNISVKEAATILTGEKTLLSHRCIEKRIFREQKSALNDFVIEVLSDDGKEGFRHRRLGHFPVEENVDIISNLRIGNG